MIRYLVAIGFCGYAAVDSDAAVANMTASRLWRVASQSEFRDAQARASGDVFFLIHPNGRHVNTTDEAWVQVLVGQGFYRVDAVDYKLFVLRHRAVDRSLAASAGDAHGKEVDDVLDQG